MIGEFEIKYRLKPRHGKVASNYKSITELYNPSETHDVIELCIALSLIEVAKCQVNH